MNKVKTIKIKNEDGSISEESYSIAADAVNVDMVNGNNVQETIGTIDVDKDGDIAAQLNKKINKSDIIDNLHSSDNNKVLSAKQGKVLNEAVAAANLDIKKKIYYFNTVAEMKSANLKENDVCQTLGYYEENDGGEGLYKIVDDDTLVDDGGSVHELNNGLKANIVAINNEINVKQFGAKGDNITDDTQSFIKACAYWQREGTIYVPKGHYKITDTITIPDILSIHGKDGCPVLEHYGNNDLISLQGHTRISEHTLEGSVNKCEIKPILKQLILRENNANSIAKAIRIDTTSDTWFARSSFDNIQVHKFNIGLKLGRYNCFILHFNRCNFVKNSIALETPDEQPLNSGERISFTDCIFDSNIKVFNFTVEGFDLFLLDCSIDYNTCLFYDMNGGGRRFIDINHCHYETSRTADNDNPHGILWGWMNQSSINITNSIIFTRITEQQFTNPGVTISRKMEINLINNDILYWEDDYNNYTGIKNLYFVPTINALRVKSKQNHFGYVEMGKPVALINNILGDAGFSKLNTGDAVINANNYIADSSGNISNFKIDSGYQTNISKYEVKDINDFTGTKSLALVPSNNTQSISSIITTDKIPMYRQLYQHFVVKNINKIEYRINYFTSENKYLSSTSWITTNISNPEVDTLLIVPRIFEYYHSKDMLQKAGYFTLSFRFTNVGLEGYIPEIMSINLFED